MLVTEGCSESRMRSRTSRGVPEWSGGKDLYMGSHILATGKVLGFPVLYREASRRFRKLPESGSPQRVLPRPKGFHRLRGVALALLGQAHKSLKAHVAWERWKVHLFMEREGIGLGVQLLPLGCALGLGGADLHAPPPIYRGEGAPQEHTRSPWRPSLSLDRFLLRSRFR